MWHHQSRSYPMTEFQVQLLHWTLSQAAEKKMCPHLKVSHKKKNIKVTNNLPGTIHISLNQLPFKECSAHTKGPLLVSFRLQVTDHIQSIFAVDFCDLTFSETKALVKTHGEENCSLHNYLTKPADNLIFL